MFLDVAFKLGQTAELRVGAQAHTGSSTFSHWHPKSATLPHITRQSPSCMHGLVMRQEGGRFGCFWNLDATERLTLDRKVRTVLCEDKRSQMSKQGRKVALYNLGCTAPMSQHISASRATFPRVRRPHACPRVSVSRLTHQVQAAAVHQRGELMKADLSRVQYPLDLLQTCLEMNEGGW